MGHHDFLISDAHKIHKPDILIVDDSDIYLESMSLVLKEDFVVYCSSNGFEALEFIKSTNISLILLDLDMPEMDGTEFLRRVRKADKNIPVFVMTGKSSHEWARKCADLGVQGYMDKFFDVAELISRIKKLLGADDYSLLKGNRKDNYESGLSSRSPIIRKALAYIQDNYHRELSREDIAFYLDVSPQYLSSLFHKECRIHLKDYINMLKVCKCKECLKDFDRKISEIGKEIGISNANYLTRLFKKHTGLTPQEFRKKRLTS